MIECTIATECKMNETDWTRKQQESGRVLWTPATCHWFGSDWSKLKKKQSNCRWPLVTTSFMFVVHWPLNHSARGPLDNSSTSRLRSSNWVAGTWPEQLPRKFKTADDKWSKKVPLSMSLRPYVHVNIFLQSGRRFYFIFIYLIISLSSKTIRNSIAVEIEFNGRVQMSKVGRFQSPLFMILLDQVVRS